MTMQHLDEESKHSLVRSKLAPYLSLNLTFGVLLLIIITSLRFYFVLNANVTKNYGNVSILFVVMVFLPFILLNKKGRQTVGIRKPKNLKWLILAFLGGITICTIIYLLFYALYGHSISNCLVYISNSYAVKNIISDDKFTYFVIYAITGMTFSPFGEELFYRGLLHQCFVPKLGERKASLVDSAAFAIAHLANFGIIYYAGLWDILVIPALLWMIGMFILSRFFFLVKQNTNSIFAAIIAHAGFNLAMTYWIFYHIF